MNGLMPKPPTEREKGMIDMLNYTIARHLEELENIKEHVESANLLWFRNFAVQEWYEELLTLVTKGREE